MVKMEFRPIIPKKKNKYTFDADAFLRYSAATVNRTIDKAQSMFNKTTATWRHKPPWKRVKATPSRLIGSTTTRDKIFTYVVKGTPRHRIRPKRGEFLVFRRGGNKTRPRYIDSYAGIKRGKPIYSTGVMHPGGRPRKFDEVIIERLRPIFLKEMRANIKRANVR